MQAPDRSALVQSHIIDPIISGYDCPAYMRDKPEAQAEYISRLTQAIIEELPSRATLEGIARALRGAWSLVFRKHRYRSWPMAPEVLECVVEAVNKCCPVEREGPRYKPAIPALPIPDECRRRAKFWATANCPANAAFWEGKIIESERAWAAYQDHRARKRAAEQQRQAAE